MIRPIQPLKQRQGRARRSHAFIGCVSLDQAVNHPNDLDSERAYIRTSTPEDSPQAPASGN